MFDSSYSSIDNNDTRFHNCVGKILSLLKRFKEMNFTSYKLETLQIKMASKRKRDRDIHTFFIRQSSGKIIQ